MAARLTPMLVRLAVLAAVALFSTATITFAADGGSTEPAAKRSAQAKPRLTVPDVRGQVYVFAKGMLEDEGFAWRVTGSVEGYAVNFVATQSPAPGTQVLDTGAPTVVLSLRRNTSYAESGRPEASAPYRGTAIELPSATPSSAQPTQRTPAPAKPAPAKPAAKPAPKKPAAPKQPTARPPAFEVAGAPDEPLDEMSLPARARKLAAWVDRHPERTDANVRHWFYQHEWIVTGAKFGWWRGAEALRVLLQIDERVIDLWGVGARSRDVAAAALREVESKAR